MKEITLEEIIKKYNVSESSLKTNFSRTMKSILKKNGIKISKVGRGKDVKYYEEIVEDNRAISLYNEVKEELYINHNVLAQKGNWEFMTFLSITVTPMMTFRGTYKDLLKYCEEEVTSYNLNKLKEAINWLIENEIILFMQDKTNGESDFFVISISRKAEKDMKLGIDMIRRCKELAEKFNKKSPIPLIKTWIGLSLMNKQTCTMAKLCEMTGMSEYLLRQSRKILEEDNAFNISKAYRNSYFCEGLRIDRNVAGRALDDEKTLEQAKSKILKTKT